MAELTEAEAIAQITNGLFDEEPPVMQDHDEPAPAPVETPEPAPEPAAEVAEPVEADEDEDQPTTTGEARPPQFRFRPVNDPKTVEVTKLLKAGLTVDEATAILAQRDSAQPQENDEPAAPDAPPTVDSMQSRLEELDALIKEAGEAESVLTPELAEALRERSDLAADLRLARRDEQARTVSKQEAEHQSFQQAFTESSETVESLYPVAKDPASDFSRALDAEVEQILNAPNHPLRGNPEAPMILGVKIARRLGIAPQTGPAPSAPATPAPAPAQAGTRTHAEAMTPRPGLTPATGAARTAPYAAQPTQAQIEADIQRQLAAAKSDSDAAGILAATLFGPAVEVSPFR